MKISLKKHLLTLEDFTKETFSNIDYDTIEARLIHNQYNKFLQYYFIKLIYDAVEASRTICNCKSRLVDRTILEKCDVQCEQIPDEELFIKFIEDKLEQYRELVYNKFDEWLEYKRHNCDNECNIFEDVDFKNLIMPKMNCLCENKDKIKEFLEFNHTHELNVYIEIITDYIDFKLDTDEPNNDIESLKWFNYISQFNELKLSQWPDTINLKGYRNYYDGAEGLFYKLEAKEKQDFGIINNFKGICYKRYYIDEVNANWFGIKYFDKHTDIFLNLLSYNHINLNDLIYNIEMKETAQRPINNDIHWCGNNAHLNIKFEGTDSVLNFILLKDIYEIKIDGLNINVQTEQDIPFINMNDDFKVDIFFFNSQLQSTLGVEKNTYITLNQESIKSDIFWSVLPFIPTIKDTDNPLQILNLGYINMIKETTVDAVLTKDTVQNVEVKYDLTNSFKVLEESEYGNNKWPLLLKYLNDTYFHQIAEKYIEGQKQKIVNQMQVKHKNNMFFANTVDNGFIDINADGNPFVNKAGVGPVNQDFNRLFHLPNYMSNLELVKSKIDYVYKNKIPLRIWKYNELNPTEPEITAEVLHLAVSKFEGDTIGDISNYINPTHNARYFSAFYTPVRKSFELFKQYYEISIKVNSKVEVNNVYGPFTFDESDITFGRLLYEIFIATNQTYTRTMKVYGKSTGALVHRYNVSITFTLQQKVKQNDISIDPNETLLKDIYINTSQFIKMDVLSGKFYIEAYTYTKYAQADDDIQIDYED